MKNKIFDKNKIILILSLFAFSACVVPTTNTVVEQPSGDLLGSGSTNGGVVVTTSASPNGNTFVDPNTGVVYDSNGNVINPNNNTSVLVNPTATVTVSPIPNSSVAPATGNGQVSTYVTPVPLNTNASAFPTSSPTSAIQNTSPITTSNSTPIPQSTFAPVL